MKRVIINIYFPLILTIILGCNKGNSQEIIYNIPYNYKGVVVIVFEEKIKKESSIFDIPKNGILYSPYLRNKGVFRNNFFYLKNKKIVKQIEKYDYQKYHNKLVTGNIYLFDVYDGKFYIKPKNETNNSNTYSTKDWKTINWIYFTIGSDESQRYDLRKKANQIIDSLQQQIIKEAYPAKK